MSQCSNSLRQLAAVAHLPFHVTLQSQLGGPSACDSIQRTGLASVVTIPPAVQLRGGLRPLQRAARALVPSPPRSGIRSSPPPAVHLPLAPAAKAALHCASMFCTKRGVVIFAWPRGLCRCLVRLVSSVLHLLLRGLLSRSRSLLSTSLALTLVAWGGSPHFPSGRRVGGGCLASSGHLVGLVRACLVLQIPAALRAGASSGGVSRLRPYGTHFPRGVGIALHCCRSCIASRAHFNVYFHIMIAYRPSWRR